VNRTRRPMSGEPTRVIVEQAALWHARLGDERTQPGQREFEAWRTANPAHSLAFDRIAGLSARIGGRDPIKGMALKHMLGGKKGSAGAALILLLFLMAGGWIASQQPTVRIWLADQNTAPGEQINLPLADGSRIVIAPGSALDMDVGAQRRTLRLLRGEVMAEVSEGRLAPFIVETDDGTALALGTAYTVRKYRWDTVVTVLDSEVEVCSSRTPMPDCLILVAGQRARLGARGVRRLGNVDIDSASAWTRGWLTVDDRPLPEVLAELGRYRKTPIGYDTQALMSLRVSGYFPLSDPNRALGSIANSLPVTVDRSDPERPVVRRR